MPRPRKDTSAKRSAQIGVRFTPDELDQISRDAARAGLPLAAFIRKRALSERLRVRKTRGLDWQTLDQLRRIGVNLNQAMRVANATRSIPPELVTAAARVEEFLTREIERDGAEGRG